ncbi:MAG: DUF6504 family protein [Thermoleophilia bacterium]|jgi:hypothetical protein
MFALRCAPHDRTATRELNVQVAQGLPTPITVVWRPLTRAPKAFVWRERRWRVERVLQRWSIDTGWWSDEVRVDRRYLRVVAEGRVFDLYLDRARRRWFLERAL